MKMKLAILGFGRVGQALARLLLAKQDFLKDKYGVSFMVAGIFDIRLGGALDVENGIDLQEVLDVLESGGTIDDISSANDDLNGLGLIEKSGADVLIEMTHTDLDSGQPAVSHCQQAFFSGKHVVTSNKGPAALAEQELWELAEENGVFFRFEGAVMSGTPAFSLAHSGLAGAEIKGFRGILNGTCNHILSRMEEGSTYDEALREAQQLGLTEANPSVDVDAWDAAAKGVILANTLLGADITLFDVERQGIRNFSTNTIEEARGNGAVTRQVVSCRVENDSVKLSVKPTAVPADDFLATIKGSMNALVLDTDTIGEVTVAGRGAGSEETAFALLSDLLWIQRRMGKSTR